MGDTYDVDVLAMSAAGDGIARIGRRELTIPFTIPGERVRVEVRSASRGPARARLIEVLRPSPHRVAPACRHFGANADPGACGGCSWQHIAYEEQLRLKTALVDDLVGRAVPGAPRATPMLASTDPARPWAFRNRVHFVFESTSRRGAGARLRMGHYARGSRRVVPVAECPVHDARGNALAFRLRDAFERWGVGAAGPAGHGVLRGVAVRAGRGTPELMATLIVTDDHDRPLRVATRSVLSSEAATTGVHLNLHPRGGAMVFGRETRHLSGPARMRQTVGGASFAVSPTAFFQTNMAAAEILVGLVLAAVPRGARVVDLYAGAGLFAVPLAQAGCLVTAVEANREAVRDGEASRSLSGVAPDRCRFIARPVEASLASLRRADAVVLDPPREGCAASVVRHVFQTMRPAVAVYVSCSAETLARDLRLATGFGYAVRSIQPVDMFPHTAHIETVVVLTR